MNFKQIPLKPTITFEDFSKVDIRIGTIIKVEEVEKSEKLVRLTVDFGEFKRNILSGIKKEIDDIHSLKGKQTLFVVNLEPRKMMGEESEGMLFSIGFENGLDLILAVPEKPVENGACTS